MFFKSEIPDWSFAFFLIVYLAFLSVLSDNVIKKNGTSDCTMTISANKNQLYLNRTERSAITTKHTTRGHLQG